MPFQKNMDCPSFESPPEIRENEDKNLSQLFIQTQCHVSFQNQTKREIEFKKDTFVLQM